MNKSFEGILLDVSTDADYLRNFGTDDVALPVLVASMNALIERMIEMGMVTTVDGHHLVVID